jgi:NAD(P)-dependent dehydrogenase (short-subunit alcohol dehydrogenase family)
MRGSKNGRDRDSRYGDAFVLRLGDLNCNVVRNATMPKCVVVGGSGGIAAALARNLKSMNYELHLIGRNEASLAEFAGQLGASHATADVTDDAQLSSALAAAGSAIDSLCYTVGTINLKPFARLSRNDFLTDFELNALAAARAIQLSLPQLRASAQPNASVLLFSSIAVAQGFTAHASVAMAKGAVEGLVKALAAELAPKIRVNAIAPSLTRTKLARSLTDNNALAQTIAGLHPLQRLGEPEDVAAMGVLLLSPQSGWITGQVIGVDGGRSTIRTRG